MRDLIALASIGLGMLLVLWCALDMRPPRRPGRQSASHHATKPLPALTGPPMRPCPTTPTPEHVRARRAPLRGEDTPLIRPYVLVDETLDLGIIRERRTAAVLATLGVDYAYGYTGDQFETLAALTTAGVTA
ncbi:hypothetical protein ACFW2Y_17615 [Streptomyces sp. NPDC058877]|uniref:hypothetical protein n=1 Tax=unclassified Streptomyces TaxID=2593676 RepID=UPI003690945B